LIYLLGSTCTDNPKLQAAIKEGVQKDKLARKEKGKKAE
jgi:hypothetical protein